MQWYKRDVRKQVPGSTRYCVVAYIASFFFNLVEKNLLLVKILSVAKMASTVYETDLQRTAKKCTKN